MGPVYALAKSVLFKLEAEKAHALTISGLKIGQNSGLMPVCDNHHTDISVELAGLKFPNPLGIAAGFDKNAEVPDAMMQLGFGFAEIGTVTPRPQAGNPRPRIFRLPKDKAIINRLGFNNQGHDRVLANLQARNQNGIVGVNIGANKDSDDFVRDYEAGIEKFWPVASYFTANISSPNTPGLRDLQAKEALSELLRRITGIRDEMAEKSGKSIPLFLKVAPDLNESSIDEICECVQSSTIDGLVVSNTTISRTGLRTSTEEMGGLSGQPLFERSTIVLAKIRLRIGNNLPIIGIGGIDSAAKAWEKMEAGANLLQLYTGMVYQGATLANTICAGLSDKLKSSEYSQIQAVTNSGVEHWAALKLPTG